MVPTFEPMVIPPNIFNSVLSRLSDPYSTPPPSSTHPFPSQEYPTSQPPLSTPRRHQTSLQTPDYHTSHKASSRILYKRSFSQDTRNPPLSNASLTSSRPSQLSLRFSGLSRRHQTTRRRTCDNDRNSKSLPLEGLVSR